jgi:hypothetical protein
MATRRKTTIALLNGGIGNQLFIYAANRARSFDLNHKLIFDCSGFKRDKEYNRRFQLQELNIPPDITFLQLDKFSGKIVNKTAELCKFLPDSIFSYIEDDSPHKYQTAFHKSSFIAYTFGYWQSEKYFKRYRRDILNELCWGPEILELSSKLINLIMIEEEPVSIHFRSYVDIKKRHNRKVLVNAYYRNAIQFIKNNIDSPKYFVFADDTSNLDLSLFTDDDNVYVVSNDLESKYSELVELCAMSHCKHFIVANSSFSWWGAYCSQNYRDLFDSNKEKRLAIYPGENTFNEDFIPEFGIKLS